MKLNKPIGKTKYPEKTSLNLVEKAKTQSKPGVQILLFVIFLVLLAVFVKFMVVDKLVEAYEAETVYMTMQNQIAQLQEANQDYEKVREEYSHYGNGYLNDAERAERDRMEMMKIIDKHVVRRSKVETIEIAENAASLTINEIGLKTVAAMVADLEDEDVVSYVTVSTAGTNRDSNRVVQAVLTIYFNDSYWESAASENTDNGSADGSTDAGSTDAGNADDGNGGEQP